jgi:hypothetical protein
VETAKLAPSGESIPERDWDGLTLKGYELVLDVVIELYKAESSRSLYSKNRTSSPDPTPKADAAFKFLREFLESDRAKTLIDAAMG